MIFVQIASYRDPELVNTLINTIDNAKSPENLMFSVCWQYHPADKFTPIQRNFLNSIDNMKLFPVDLSETPGKGACWARNQLQKNYAGEQYTLQLDSHMRFVKNWDERLLEMYKSLLNKGVKKPLITSYVPSFDPDKEPNGRLNEVWRMDFDRFCPEGWIATAPSLIQNWQDLSEPVPARFYSAHFAFADGSFVKEVPHDPEFYFHGEEPSIAIRAYTWGYDLYHPHRIICWHEYQRNGKVKQWDDNPAWIEQNRISHERYRSLFGMDGQPKKAIARYGLGPHRSLEDYKRYSGIDVKTRKIQMYTKDRNNPPNPVIEDNEAYEASFYEFFRHCIDLDALRFPEPDYDLWVISFENRDQTNLARLDAGKEEIYSLIETSKSDGNWIRLWREYYGPVPEVIIIWPHSESKGWMERIVIDINR